MFVPVLFRHPDGCRCLWQAHFNVYSSLFALESSRSHATLSHLKGKQEIISPTLKQQTGRGLGEVGNIGSKYYFSMVDWQSLLQVPVFQQDKHVNMLWSHYHIIQNKCNYLCRQHICIWETSEVQPHSSFFTKTYIYSSLIYTNGIEMGNPLYITNSQTGALHISPSTPRSFAIRVNDARGGGDKLENRDNT